MKFVALMSGGKDSCYSVMRCLQHGHVLVALANLHPQAAADASSSPGRGGEDTDSFMYQTAAHNLLPAIAECMGAPLVRRAITGTAVVQTLQYGSSGAAAAGDEVEDLFLLLQKAKQRFPDVLGVSCGAILSTYQRLRVEHVCDRLGLTPLTYLWQRSRGELLDEMIGSKIDAVLVKIAGGGLTPKHLGKSIRELKPTLYQLHGRYGLDICGEGGEYETIVLDCPLYKTKRIQITSSQVLVDDTNCDSVANLKVLKYSLVDKEIDCDIVTESDAVSTSAGDSCIQKCVVSALASSSGKRSAQRGSVSGGEPVSPSTLPKLFRSWDGVLQTQLIVPRRSTDQPVEAQMNEVMTLLAECVSARTQGSCTIRDVVYAHLYLRDMSLFERANSEYCKFFAEHPPSRSCVAAGDGSPGHPLVAIDAVLYEQSHASIASDGGRSSRRGVLHVKGFSEWAPVCIGPYSQANALDECVVYVAGQIPLDPATMTISAFLTAGDEAVYYQLALCMRHCHRVLASLDSGLGKAIAVTVFVDVSADSVSADLASVCEEMLRQGLLAGPDAVADGEPTAWSRGVSAYDRVSDSDSGCESGCESGCDDDAKSSRAQVAPVQVVGVFGLPRGAAVEVQLVAATNRVRFSDGSVERKSYHVSRVPPADRSPPAVFSDKARLVAGDVENWPLWRCGYAGIDSSEPSQVELSLTLISSTRQLCSGTVDVSLPPQQYPPLSLHDALCTCYVEIAAAAADSGVRQSAIKYVKVYYNLHLVDKDDISTSSVSATAAVFGSLDVPVIVIPTTRLVARRAIFSVSFLYYDILQMRTESWIDGC